MYVKTVQQVVFNVHPAITVNNAIQATSICGFLIVELLVSATVLLVIKLRMIPVSMKTVSTVLYASMASVNSAKMATTSTMMDV